MRIFYAFPDGQVVASAKPSLRDITDLFEKLLPERVILEDTKQVAIRPGVFGNQFAESFYALRGYEVKFV